MKKIKNKYIGEALPPFADYDDNDGKDDDNDDDSSDCCDSYYNDERLWTKSTSAGAGVTGCKEQYRNRTTDWLFSYQLPSMQWQF